MAKRNATKQKRQRNKIEMSPEFRQWLRSQNVKRRTLQKDPAAFQSYHQQWIKSQNPTKKRGLLSMLPNMDLDTMTQNVGKMHEILNMVQSVKQMMGNKLF